MKIKAVSGIMLTLLLISMLTLAFKIELVSAIIPPEPEYPAIYVDPPIVENIMPPNNFTVSIKTDYNGTDIWAWEFQTLSYNPNVLQGGIQGTDMWTGDGVNKTFDMAVENVVPDSEEVYVNGTLMTIETEGNDTWPGDGVKTTFDTTIKPLVEDSEVIRVNGALMTRKTNGNDTWTGDGVTKMFNVTKKPLVVGEMRVYVNGTLQIPGLQYTVDYSKGIIELKTVPGVGAEIKATYKYGHYTVNYSEGTINFYTAPGVGADVKATYIYEQYAMDYTQGSITFMIAPSAGAKVEVTYLYGGITNGDLITKDKHSTAEFKAGTFNNTSGRLSYTYANFFYIPPQSIPVTSGPGTLATVTFTVVDKGTSDITLEKPVLAGGHEEEMYHIINETMPDHIGHGYFDNTAPPPAVTATIDIHPYTLNLKSKGKWITAHIELPEDYDVGDINVPTILLNDVVPAEHGKVSGKMLMVKFDKSKVIALLSQAGEVELTITGTLIDGTRFEGSDTIKVISG